MPGTNALPGVLLLALSIVVLPACTSPGSVVDEEVPRSGQPFANRPENFQFVIVGDRTGGHRPGVFGHALERINQLQPEFVVGVGDLIEGYKEYPAELVREWDEFDRMVAGLQMPFFYTVGNHDFGNEISRKLWLQRYGRDYYHFRYQDVLFISLNTEDPPVILSDETLARQTWLENMMQEDPQRVRELLRQRQNQGGSNAAKPRLPGQVAISEAQLAWIEQTLGANRDVRWTILLMHKPAWEYDSPAFTRIEQLLDNRPYTVIAGHEHFFNYSRRQDRDFVTMATTGGIWLSEAGGAFDHIAWVTMTDEGPVIATMALCGLLGTPQQTLAAMNSDPENYCFRPDRDR